jgi:putative endonuclease
MIFGPREDDDGSEIRRRAYRWGLSAETRAAWYLRLKGYRILARRYKVARGEIDLVARKGTILAFVEVKARVAEVDALAAVGPKTRRRIEAAADIWGTKYPYYQTFSWRYDIIVVTPGRWPLHIVDAFRTGE